jgi:hypothetical protein
MIVKIPLNFGRKERLTRYITQILGVGQYIVTQEELITGCP